VTFTPFITNINQIQFNAGAPAYTFNLGQFNGIDFNGAGIINNSASIPTFNLANGLNSAAGIVFNSGTAANARINMTADTDLFFLNASTAGSATINVMGSAGVLTTAEFFNTSSAGTATINNNFEAQTLWAKNATAAHAVVTTDAGLASYAASSGSGAGAGFYDNATAGNATLINRNGALNWFQDATTAANATIFNSSFGITAFRITATAGNAVITNTGSGSTATAFIQVNYINPGIPGLTPPALIAAWEQPNNNAGITQFTDQSTAANATITNNAGGVTIFGLAGGTDTASAGNATITNNSAGGTFFFANTTASGATIINTAGGVVDISGLSASGIGIGSLSGAGNIFLGSKVLALGGLNGNDTISGVISDGGTSGGTGGSLVKVGTGTLTLAGINTYTGATTVDGGMLVVNGSIAQSSSVNVNSGGTLSGNGTVDPTTITINAGGMLAPGLPGQPGTFMTIAGNLAFQSGAIYLVQLNPSSTTFTTVTGTASLAGTVQAFFAPGTYVVPKSYDILKSSGLSGTTFSGVVASQPNFQANLSYTPTDVFLNLTAILGLGGNLTINQNNVATALNNFFNNGGTLPPNFSTVFGLTGPALANALNQIDGEASVDAEATAFKSMNQFLSLMLDPFVDGRTGSPSGGALGFAPDQPASLPPDVALAYDSVLKAPPKPAAFDQRWTAWGSAYGGASHTDGDPAVIGSTNFSAQTYGFAAGMDRHFSPDMVAGFALAGGGTHWDLAQAMGGGRSDAFQAGVYATKYFGPAYVAADLAFANNWFTTNRTAFAGDQLTASFNGQSYGGRIEAGYRYSLPALWTVTPYGALQVQNFHTPQYSETDLTGGGFGLSYNAMSAYDTRSELGARFDEPTTLNGMPLTLRARLAWAHDWVDGPTLQAVFQTLPGANFVVNGAAVPKNSALTTAGAELHLTQALSFLTKFDGEFAKGSQTYAGTGTLRYAW
jgi:autotransporter-associated beta strand protein